MHLEGNMAETWYLQDSSVNVLISFPIHFVNNFNLLIVTRIVRGEWKCSKGIPLYKQGKRADMSNYRAISLIPVVAKVFERDIYDELYAYLFENNVISLHKSGFRALRFTMYSHSFTCFH